MSLFQKIVVKKYLKNLSSDLIDENYKKYTKYFNNFSRTERIRTLKEEQYQEGFLRELFVDCLNYTINPNENFNLTTEFKNKTNAEKADGAILKNGNPIAVIELKSTKTKDLRTIEKQAFNYKVHQSNCKYVITSNFEKIRLYIDDAPKFEEFNLFQLSKEKFKFLYLCLSKDSIFSDKPSLMKEKSNQHEEQISKKLYNDYSDFRNKIFRNLTKNNPQFDKLLLFKKSQKLLDRFLFIFFAEDKGLIPANMVSQIIEDYKKLKGMDHYTPLFSEFKRFFKYINEGNPKYNISAYNGGLFQFDDILDNVIIDDEILIKDSLKLSNYDFDSEIDVNILGHIFEHSLTEIEKINAELSGNNLDKKQTRRKKEGVFYTPSYITKYIVENTIRLLCEEKKKELKLFNLEVDETYFRKSKNTTSKKGVLLFDQLERYKEWLLSLKIIDPACGSGAFLNQALNFLIDEHNFIIDLETDLRKDQLSAFDIDTAVLENNLYGVDINEESVEIAKLSLWLKTAKRGRKLTDLSKHIKCGNSLIDDPEIEKGKAFNWNEEFPEIMHKGGFDVVIGNPPYVRAEVIANKKYLLSNYQCANGNADLYVYFYEKGITLLKNNGILSYIAPNKWIRSNYGIQLRNYISNYYFSEFIDFGELKIFNGVGTFPSIATIIKKKPDSFLRFKEIMELDEIKKRDLHCFEFSKISHNNLSNNNWNLSSNEINSLISKLESKYKPLSNSVGNKFFAGIKSGLNKLFIYSENEVKKITNNDPKELLLFRKICFGRELEKYHLIITEQKYLFFPYTFVNNINTLIKLEDYENTFKYFSHYKSQLSSRSIIKEGIVKGTHKWYELQQINKYVNYDEEKIIYPDISIQNRFVLDVEKYIPDMTCFFIPSNNKAYLPIFNSTLFKFLASNYCPILGNIKKGGRIRFKSTYVSKIPFPKSFHIDNKQIYVEKADIMLSLNKQKQVKINNFLHRMKANFELENFSNKMKTFFDFDFKILISELKKKKVKLTLPQQDEWEEYFNNYKNEINKLQKKIAYNSKEIDQMVYELYCLTKKEIEIVEKWK
ncbi:MAG: Eco57I restriction-modification methylase domain-containing protein [Candidatus Tenebribacter burtonii]|nr:Eco57I restriction-modification methylase domain-containing protein [Candidatus Tenebribacter burtonii]